MYTKIESLIWKDKKFNELSNTSKLIFVYLLTTPHRNIIGLYYLPLDYLKFDLGLDKGFSKGFSKLLENGFIEYDEDTNMILVKKFLKYNPLENKNQVTSAINRANDLPPTYLMLSLIEHLQQVDGDRCDLLIKELKRLGKGLDKGLPKGLPKGYGKQEEETEEGTEEELKHLWNLYPKKKGKEVSMKKLPLLIKKYSFEEIKRCIERYVKETTDSDMQYIKNGSTFFNSGYVDYLDANYQEVVKVKKQGNKFHNFNGLDNDEEKELEKILIRNKKLSFKKEVTK